MSRRRVSIAVWLSALVVATGCATAQAGSGGPVELEFFQFKPEAIGTFDALIADFNEQHPDIRVQQNPIPESETAIRIRMVREDVPDVMTLNGNYTFGELAAAGVFHDFSQDPVLEGVTPAIVEILNDLGTYADGEVNGVPFASNANGVLYNKDLFEKHGVSPPRTWDEMLTVLETFEDAGVTPVYGTLQDAWTSLAAWNPIAANAAPENFWDQLRADQTSFREGHADVAERVRTVFDHAQDTKLARNYEAGNQAFAAGESAMLLQGNWAIPAVLGFEPDFELGVFALPADREEQTRLVSGVDVALTMGRNSAHPEEAMTFIEYLMSPEVVSRYAEEQSAFPTLESTVSDDPILQDLVPFFEQERLTGFPDHQVPPAVGLPDITQSFLTSGDTAAYLETLDNEWDKVAARQS